MHVYLHADKKTKKEAKRRSNRALNMLPNRKPL